jgi:hypothetical protein
MFFGGGEGAGSSACACCFSSARVGKYHSNFKFKLVLMSTIAVFNDASRTLLGPGTSPRSLLRYGVPLFFN